jgi:Helix-turn-helix of DDE superfamily endonuclease
MPQQKPTPLVKPLSKYDQLKDLKPSLFRRLTGVKPTIFAKMVVVLRRSEKQIRRRGGRKPLLSVEDRLLLALEYLREYRTYFHIGQSYGVSESHAHNISQWVEDTLIKDKLFALPGKKALLKSDQQIEVVLVDASESPVERPKKDKRETTLARRSATP